MAIVNRSTLKSYFKRLFKPTQENFENLIDSVVLQTDPVETFIEKANQGEAEAGIDNTKVMTPVRVKEAILSLANLATVPTLNTEVTALLTALKNELIGGASDAMNTFKELETEILENEGGLTALSALIATKMAKSANGSDIPDTKAFLENINTYSKEEILKWTASVDQSKTHIDQYVDTGVYSIANYITGQPALPIANVANILVVYSWTDGGRIKQRFINTNSHYEYTRYTTDGTTWSDWKEVPTIDKLIQNTGEQVLDGTLTLDSLQIDAEGSSSISGAKVNIDINDNELRLFEQGSPQKGVKVDLSRAADNIGTEFFTSSANLTTSQLGNDLDSYTNVGHYRVRNVIANTPSGYTSGYNDFHVLVMQIDSRDLWIRQTLWDIRSDRCFTRAKRDGVWTVWKELLHEGNSPIIIHGRVMGDGTTSYLNLNNGIGISDDFIGIKRVGVGKFEVWHKFENNHFSVTATPVYTEQSIVVTLRYMYESYFVLYVLKDGSFIDRAFNFQIIR